MSSAPPSKPQLRPYQQQAVDQTFEHLEAGKRSVLIVAPTGAGKTVVATEIMRRAVDLGGRTLFLVHRRELVRQTVGTLQRFCLDAGVIIAGQRRRSEHPIQVASVQTLIRREVPKVHLVVIDETHHYLEDNSYGQIVEATGGASVVGVTATPWRLDGRGLGDLFDAHVMTRSPAQLRDEGFLVPVTGWVFQPIDVSGVGTSRGDYKATELAQVSLQREIVGDVVREWLERSRGLPTILFACGVEHSRRFAEEFRAAGVTAAHFDGSTPREERDAILARARRGEIQVLCNCAVATEGFDLPELSCVILARPTKSSALYLQMVGRVLRPAPGKTAARIHDHAGCIEAHGEPYAEREWRPDASMVEANAKATVEGLPKCPKCGAITSDRPCPECKFEGGSVREAPRLNPDAVAVPIEQITKQRVEGRDGLTGRITWKRPGQEVVGKLVTVLRDVGRFGPEEQWHCVTEYGVPFYLAGTADLRSKLPREPGTWVRVIYDGVKELGEGRTMKRFQVYQRRGAA